MTVAWWLTDRRFRPAWARAWDWEGGTGPHQQARVVRAGQEFVVGHKLPPEDLRRARHTGQNLSPLTTTLWDKHSPGQAHVRTRAHEHKHTPQDKHTRAARTGPRCRSSKQGTRRVRLVRVEGRGVSN